MSQEIKDQCIKCVVCCGCALLILLTISFLVCVCARIDHPKCEGEWEIINQIDVYDLKISNDRPIYKKYDVMCKDTGEIKTYKDFK